MVFPSLVGDVKIVSQISAFVLNTVTLKQSAFHFILIEFYFFNMNIKYLNFDLDIIKRQDKGSLQKKTS